MTGPSFCWNSRLQLVLHFLDVLLCVVGEALDLRLLAIDVLGELRACGVTQDAGAGVELLLRRLQRLVLLVQLGDLLGVEPLHPRLSALPCADSAAMRWMLTNAYFAPVGKGCSAGAACAAAGGAAGAGAGRLGEGWSGSQGHAEGRGNDKSSHYSQSFPVVQKLMNFNTLGP